MSSYSTKYKPRTSSSFGGPRRRFSGGSGSAPRYNNNRRSGGGRPRGQYIDPARFVSAAQSVEVVAYEPTHQFSDFVVEAALRTNLTNKGYVTPSPIQDQAIPLALKGSDIIGIANTGTGKTAAFAVPILNRLMTDPNARALVIAPTRELAQQIEDEFRSIGKSSGLFSAVLIGGANIGPQIRDLRANPRIVIGTPGRIKDHLERRSLELGGFNLVVLDEVDRMLDMGFINDVTEILAQLADKRQSFFFSATMDPRIKVLIEKFANDPVTISLKTNDASANVNQNVIRYGSSEEKLSKLHDLLLSEAADKTIVFDETQRNVERLAKELASRGFITDAIHGGKSQGQRQRALNRFKKNEIKILVATDVAARGIDVVDITHVVNYSIPQSYDDYIHRVGRAGRAGRPGHALTFVSH